MKNYCFIALLAIFLIVAISLAGFQANIHPPEPLYFLEGKEGVLFFTFNVLWEADNLEYILSTLRDNDIKAIFFVTGEWITKFPHEAENIISDGHHLGNQTYSNKRLLLLNEAEVVSQISKFNETASEKLNYNPRFFRPSYGEYNSKIVQLAKEEGCITLLWSINTLMLGDWETGTIISRLEENLHEGAVLLFHTSSPQIEHNLEEIIEFVQWKGYHVAPPRLLIENYPN